MSGENVAARASGSIVATIEGRIQEAKCEGLIDNPSRCRTSIADLSCSPRPASSSEHGARAQSAVTRPVVSEKACPLETIAPVAADGHSGLAVLRKPPGAGPFPVVVWFHGGIATVPLTRLEATARDLATGSRFLAGG